jgi:hypothetical protein
MGVNDGELLEARPIGDGTVVVRWWREKCFVSSSLSV